MAEFSLRNRKVRALRVVRVARANFHVARSNRALTVRLTTDDLHRTQMPEWAREQDDEPYSQTVRCPFVHLRSRHESVYSMLARLTSRTPSADSNSMRILPSVNSDMGKPQK